MYLFERQTWTKRKTEWMYISLLISKMITKLGPNQSYKPGNQHRAPMWVVGTQLFESSLLPNSKLKAGTGAGYRTPVTVSWKVTF